MQRCTPSIAAGIASIPCGNYEYSIVRTGFAPRRTLDRCGNYEYSIVRTGFAARRTLDRAARSTERATP